MQRSEAAMEDSMPREKEEEIDKDMDAAEDDAGGEEEEEEDAKNDGDDTLLKRRRRKYAVWVAYVGAGYHVSP